MAVRGVLTAEEFATMESPENCRDELWDGQIVQIPFQTPDVGTIHANLIGVLGALAREHPGVHPTGRCGYVVRRDPDCVIAPPASLTSKLDAHPLAGPWEVGAPVLACEILVPGITAEWMSERVTAYLAAGARRVWLLYPATASLTVHRDDGNAHTYTGNDVITSDDAGFSVDGFEARVSDFFAELD